MTGKLPSLLPAVLRMRPPGADTVPPTLEKSLLVYDQAKAGAVPFETVPSIDSTTSTFEDGGTPGTPGAPGTAGPNAAQLNGLDHCASVSVGNPQFESFPAAETMTVFGCAARIARATSPSRAAVACAGGVMLASSGGTLFEDQL